MKPYLRQVTTMQKALEEDVRAFAEAACHAMEIGLTELEAFLANHAIDDVRELTAQCGLTLAALSDRPDWPFVPHDLRTIFPDEAAIAQVLDNLDRASQRSNADNDIPFLRAYFPYFSGQRAAAAALFWTPPAGGSTTHFEKFHDAIERQCQR